MWINHKDWCSNKEYKIAQDSWVRHYKNQLEKLRPWDYSDWRRKPVSEQFLFKYYREGRMFGRLQLMDFKQFAIRITESPYNYGGKKWKRDRICNHYKYNRDGKRNPTNYSEKKVLSETEQAKRQWREFKKDPRDQKHSKNYRGAKRQFKHDCARFHRNLERHCLANGNYDDLHDKTWKQVINWWSYD